MNYKLILILILAGFAVLFTIQNVATVEVQLLLWSFKLSRALLLFFVLAIGIIIGWSIHSYLIYRKSEAEDDF